MKKTFKSILAVVMAFIMVSGFVSAFAVENVVYPSDYVEKVTITNYEKCATIIESEDGDLIAPSTEGETVTLIFTDGTEKSFVYADEIKVEFPDGKEYEIYAGIEGSSLSYIVSIIH